MIWLTLRQQRLEALIAGTILVLLAAFLLATGLEMASTYQRLGVATCLRSHSLACQDVIEAFRSQYGGLSGMVDWLALLPLVFGVLLAAPFVLELEQGTYRLVWTQGITRTRWVMVKLGLLIAAALLVALAMTALLTWWHIPLDHLDGSFQPSTFDIEGAVPFAYTVFAVALGLGLGTLLRRTVPSIAISLVGFLGLRLGLQGWARPGYRQPVVSTGSFQRSDWIFGQSLHDRLGHQVNMIDLVRTCGTAQGAHGAQISAACLQQHGFTFVTTYQPGTRFWLFQGIESGIFLGLAAALLAVTIWWIRERVT
jgi:hypothetical protein